jgi:hypothetical protein
MRIERGGTVEVPAQAAAVVALRGGIAVWDVRQPEDEPVLLLTDVDAADWLWRLFGERAHLDVLAGAGEAVVTEAALLAELRRLAWAHWLRRWWPASLVDAVPVLDGDLLAAETALLTDACAELLDDFDADPAELLSGRAAGLRSWAAAGDPRVGELVDRAARLALRLDLDETEPQWRSAPTAVPPERRLAAVAGGRARRRGPALLAAGAVSVCWDAVPPDIFDAAERTADWAVLIGPDASPTLQVAAALLPDGDASGIGVRAAGAGVRAHGSLGADGAADLPLLAAGGAALTEDAALLTDFADLRITVGVESTETPQSRDRLRGIARARLAAPGPEALLAEILAAEEDF